MLPSKSRTGRTNRPGALVQECLEFHRDQFAALRSSLEAAVREADQGLTTPLTDELLAQIKAEAERELGEELIHGDFSPGRRHG
jgi:hypothetical protein